MILRAATVVDVAGLLAICEGFVAATELVLLVVAAPIDSELYGGTDG